MRQLIIRAGSACPLFKLAAFGLAMAFTFTACGEHSFDTLLDSLHESSDSKVANKESSSSSKTDNSSCTLTDSRDGKVYRCVEIGSQTWMAENLNYNASGSKCYDNKPANCDKYGRLYNWATAMALPSSCNTSDCYISTTRPNHQGTCPSGWHLPSTVEWDVLKNSAGGESTAGTKLKATSGWNNNGNGTDDFGFTALPGGGGRSDGSFYEAGNYSHWWTAIEYNDYEVYCRFIGYDNAYFFGLYDPKDSLLEVRCVKD